MSLVVTFVVLAVVIGTVLFGVTALIQPYMYTETVEQLPARSAAGGAGLAAFLTAWVAVNAPADPPDKYGTLVEFNHTAVRDVTEFEAVRRLAGTAGREQTVRFARLPTGDPPQFAEVGRPDKRYALNSSAYMTTALVVPLGGEKVRFEADLGPGGRTYQPGKAFVEKGGRRYLEGEYPHRVFAPSGWAVVAALALNALHFAAWFAVFWPLLRYGSGMALGLAAGFGLACMLVVMPLLFQKHRRPPAAAPPPAVRPA